MINNQIFSLQPFSSANSLSDLKITGNITRQNQILTIKYKLLGNLTELVIPPLASTPIRKNELWQSTCFEFFLGISNSSHYWEFNLSPTGDWNVYRFTNYRENVQEEMAFSSLSFNLQKQSNSLILNVELDLNKIIQIDQDLDIAITSVIKSKNNKVTYWALTHCGSQADFHQRDSFIIQLLGIRSQ